MSKLKLFLENFLIYGLGGIISKAIPIIMTPVITYLMPEPFYFGLNDLTTTVSSFATYIAILGMYDALYRYFFESKDLQYRRELCSTALFFVVGMALVVDLALWLFDQSLALFVYGNERYTLLIHLASLAALMAAVNSILSAPTRMQNHRRVFLVVNTVAPILGYIVSVPLLLTGHYVIALPLGSIASGFLINLGFYKLNYAWFSMNFFNWGYLRQMLILALPTAPSFLVYWVFNSCDRIMLAELIGVGATGVYAVGAKLGQASNLLYTAFAGGWQYFAFSTMNEDNQVEANSRVFEYLGVISFVVGMFICAITYTVHRGLFTGDYVLGYEVSPYLFLSPLLLMLYQVVANQFLVIKKTWPGTVILAIGAVCNICLNYLLIPIYGVEGAGMATLCGYIITVVVVSFVLMRMGLMVLRSKFISSTVAVIAFFFIWRQEFRQELAGGIILAFGYLLIVCILYRHDIVDFVGLVHERHSTVSQRS